MYLKNSLDVQERGTERNRVSSWKMTVNQNASCASKINAMSHQNMKDLYSLSGDFIFNHLKIPKNHPEPYNLSFLCKKADEFCQGVTSTEKLRIFKRKLSVEGSIGVDSIIEQQVEEIIEQYILNEK